jgi:hypothetical protein
VPPKSFVRPHKNKTEVSLCETRKDSAAHVSLSSSQLVKQPDAIASYPVKGKSRSLIFQSET